MSGIDDNIEDSKPEQKLMPYLAIIGIVIFVVVICIVIVLKVKKKKIEVRSMELNNNESGSEE